MFLGGLYGPLISIATMVFLRYKLEVYLPVLFHEFLEFGAHLVVEYLNVDREAFGGESFNHGIVWGKTIFVVTTVEAGVDNVFGFAVARNHDIFIATSITDRGDSSVISV